MFGGVKAYVLPCLFLFAVKWPLKRLKASKPGLNAWQLVLFCWHCLPALTAWCSKAVKAALLTSRDELSQSHYLRAVTQGNGEMVAAC